jgi:hypothetical protein
MAAQQSCLYFLQHGGVLLLQQQLVEVPAGCCQLILQAVTLRVLQHRQQHEKQLYEVMQHMCLA